MRAAELFDPCLYLRVERSGELLPSVNTCTYPSLTANPARDIGSQRYLSQSKALSPSRCRLLVGTATCFECHLGPKKGVSALLADIKLRDSCILVAVCLAVFGNALVGARPLTMHEAVLPQSAREMLADRDWIVPKSGGRPWIERPPLPQWITVATAVIVGRCDAEWIVRLPSVAIATVCVLLTASVAARWFGRATGIISGIVLATSFEFTSYAWLAEQDIYLCGILTIVMALFVRLEWLRGNVASISVSEMERAPMPIERHGSRFLTGRSWTVFAFFAALGATNLAKGVLFGPVLALLPIAAFLALCGDRSRLSRYIWLWGWFVFLAVAFVWPAAVLCRYPDAIEVWKYDLLGRMDGGYSAISQPWWYYLATLPWVIAPWTPAAIVGVAVTAPVAWNGRTSPERFVWLWAMFMVVALSVCSGKHHHYLLHTIPAWSMISAIGVRRIWHWFAGWQWSPRPATAAPLLGLVRNHPVPLLAAIVVGFALGYAWLYNRILPERDQCREDTLFVRQVAHAVSTDQPLYVNADLGSMDLFRVLFYLQRDVRTLHHLGYLLDGRLSAEQVFVITRSRDRAHLMELGETQEVLLSARTRREGSPADRLALFSLRFWPHLARRVLPDRISPMQAMGRAE